jgi:hypothetical protein
MNGIDEQKRVGLTSKTTLTLESSTPPQYPGLQRCKSQLSRYLFAWDLGSKLLRFSKGGRIFLKGDSALVISQTEIHAFELLVKFSNRKKRA